jgi:WD40 repeat protein
MNRAIHALVLIAFSSLFCFAQTQPASVRFVFEQHLGLGEIENVQHTPSGWFIGQDGRSSLILWPPNATKPIRLEPGLDDILAVRIDASGHTLLATSWKQTKTWSLPSLRERKTFWNWSVGTTDDPAQNPGYFTPGFVAFSPDGSRMARLYNPNNQAIVYEHDTRSGALRQYPLQSTPSFTFYTHDRRLYGVFYPENQPIEIRSLPDQTLVLQLPQETIWRVNANGKQLSHLHAGKLTVLQFPSLTTLATLEMPEQIKGVYNFALDRAAKNLYLLDQKNRLHRWSLRSGKIASLETIPGWWLNLGLWPDKTFGVWDQEGQRMFEIDRDGRVLSSNDQHSKDIRTLYFDGSSIVSAEDGGGGHRFDLTSGLVSYEPPACKKKYCVYSTARTRDGRIGFSYETDAEGNATKLIRFDARTGNILSTGPFFGGIASISPDGRLALTRNRDSLEVTDSINGDFQYALRNSVDADFSPDGRHLVSITANTIRLLEAQTGETRWKKTLPDPDSKLSLHGVRFSPDGSYLVVAVGDPPNSQTRLLAFNLEGQPIGETPLPAGEWGRLMTFSPDGQRVASIGSRGGVSVWQVQR